MTGIQGYAFGNQEAELAQQAARERVAHIDRKSVLVRREERYGAAVYVLDEKATKDLTDLEKVALCGHAPFGASVKGSTVYIYND